MNEVVRKIVSVADLPEKLREGLDPSRPVEIVQEVLDHPTASQRLRQMTGELPFRRLESGEEAVERVRRIRDGGPI
jgi:GTP cyclohydrolase FolE2